MLIMRILDALQAHRSHRKAEFYSKCHQYSEAILNYSKACEYLDKAINNSRCDIIRSSLIVQRAYNLEQIEFLKKRLLSKIRKDIHSQSSELNAKPVESNISTKTTPTSARQMDGKHHDLYQVIEEQNSLLSSLSSGQKEAQSLPEENLSSNQDTTTVSKLKTLNDQLRQMVDNLVSNLEKSQHQIQALKDENNQLRAEVSSLKNAGTNTFPELPPLEPPKLIY